MYVNRHQRAKKVVSNSPGLVDFATGLVNFALNLPDGQVKVFGEFTLINPAHPKKNHFRAIQSCPNGKL